MAQHALLILIAPPLLLAGRPGVAMAHALPPPMARAVGRSVPARALRRLGRPLPAAGLHAAALWLWHAPPFYDLALQSPWLHWLEHAVFLGTAMLLWRAVLAGPAPAAFAAPRSRCCRAACSARCSACRRASSTTGTKAAPSPGAYRRSRTSSWRARSCGRPWASAIWPPACMPQPDSCAPANLWLHPSLKREEAGAFHETGLRLDHHPVRVLSAIPALAQGNDSSSSTAAASGGNSGRVEAGAGATSAAATIGSSGPASPASASQPPTPLPPGFAIRPQVDPFWGPAALAIALDRPLRCELVADANARRHCERRGRIDERRN